MKSYRQLKGAIFDLDGTLLDSMGLWSDIDGRFLSRRGLSVSAEYTQEVKRMHFDTAAEYTKRLYNLPESEEDIKAEWRAMCSEAYATRIELKAGADRYLNALRASGVAMYIATVLEEGIFMPALRRLGVAELFGGYVTVKEAGRGKEHPDIYMQAAERMGLKPCECAVYEDIFMALQSARRAGCVSVGVYDRLSDGDTLAIKSASDYYIDDFRRADIADIFGARD